MSGTAIVDRNDLRLFAKRLRSMSTKPMSAAFFIAMVGLAFTSGYAAAVEPTGLIWNRVSLACWIENEKVIAVVNSTGKTLPAGTKLSVDAIRIPDGSHYRKSTTLGRTATGGIIRMGAVPSSSCTASARLPMPVLKTQ